MKSRDEILAVINWEPFSTRHCFYGLLEQFATRRVEAEIVTFKWPEALGVISIEDWNTAYTTALEMAADLRRRSADA
jgi:hypothetical protein